MISARTPDLFGPEFDFTDPDRMQRQGPPVEQFARLRRTAPVWWNPQTSDRSGGFHDGGFWVVSKHADIRAISRDSEAWSTNDNGVIVRHNDTITKDELESTKSIFINQDPPTHTRLRNLVSRLFTPRAVAALEGRLRKTANAIVQRAAQGGTGDFVADIAVDLPLSAIADLLGVPASDRAKLFHWSNSMMNVDDPEYGGSERSGSEYGSAMEASAELFAYAYEMAEQRKKNPTNDIISVLVNVDADGEQLSELEFGFFVLLLVVAGNETTRNAGLHQQSRSVGAIQARAADDRCQRDRPVGNAGQRLPANRSPRCDRRRRDHRRRTARRIVLRISQFRRGRIRRAIHVQRSA
jgi:cholest-4-en-3-one 26-monooxygenase